MSTSRNGQNAILAAFPIFLTAVFYRISQMIDYIKVIGEVAKVICVR